MVIEYNNDLYSIVQFQHVKPGKGAAFVRTKLKSVTSGKVVENTFPAGSKVNEARVERRPYQYLYKDDMGYVFMHTQSFEQLTVSESMIAPTWVESAALTTSKNLKVKSAVPVLLKLSKFIAMRSMAPFCVTVNVLP